MFDVVLLLNQDYRPLSVCSIRRSIRLLHLNKAESLHKYENRYLRSVSKIYSYPSVIRLRYYVKVYHRVIMSRKNILRRDNHQCQYCGKQTELTIDHVIPKSKGGGDDWNNLVTACIKCNTKKGQRTPKEANMPLLNNPFRPIYLTFLINQQQHVHISWKPYLFQT